MSKARNSNNKVVQTRVSSHPQPFVFESRKPHPQPLCSSAFAMPNVKKTAEERIDHWNVKAEEQRLRALMQETVEVLLEEAEYFAAVASKLRSLGVECKSDMRASGAQPTALTAGEASEPVSSGLREGMSLEEMKFADLKALVLKLDGHYCNTATLKLCKEGKARDVNKDTLLKLIELTCGARRTFALTGPMAANIDQLHKDFSRMYSHRGQLFRTFRLPLKWDEYGACYTKRRGKTFLLVNGATGDEFDLERAGIQVTGDLCGRFEENWSFTHSTLVLSSGERIHCNTLVPFVSHKLALQDGDDGRQEEPMAKRARASGSRRASKAIEDAPPPPRRQEPACLMGEVAEQQAEDSADSADTHQRFADETSGPPPPPHDAAEEQKGGTGSTAGEVAASDAVDDADLFGADDLAEAVLGKAAVEQEGEHEST